MLASTVGFAFYFCLDFISFILISFISAGETYARKPQGSWKHRQIEVFTLAP